MAIKQFFTNIVASLLLLASVNSFANDCTDTELIDLVSHPYTDTIDTRNKLASLEERLLFHHDRRAIFLSVYLLVTETMRESIELGVYENTEWIRSYLTIFADKYREAFYNYEIGNLNAVPGTWIIAFDTAITGENLILQDVLLGMTAHITRDLAYAIHDVGISPDYDSRFRDHRLVNEYLAVVYEDINIMLSDLYGPGIDDLLMNEASGPLLAQVVGKGMVSVRDRAWMHGVLLSRLRWGFRDFIDWYIEATSVDIAFIAIAPNIPPNLYRQLREEEGSDPLSMFCAKFPCMD